MLIVKKFGGTSVANADRIKHVAQIIIDSYKKDNKVIVVLSAQGDTTDDLIKKAMEIDSNVSKREMDMLLATGEQQSVALMAMAIHSLGYPAVSLNASQCGILSTSNYSNARIRKIDTERIENELENKNIVIITGFQGINRHGNITTLGRGGSDTSAVALAAALNADLCEIYTDVDGVYTCDPRIVKNAKKLSEISYDEMLELATLGAKVLHNRSVELAKKYNVNLVVRSSMSDAEGTIVKEGSKMEKMQVRGVAVDKDISRISIIDLKDEPGVAFRLFSALAKANISVDVILQSIGRSGKKDISFTISKDDLKGALELLKNQKEYLGYSEMSHAEEIAKLSIVGAGMATDTGVAAKLFEALYNEGINVKMISTSEIKISVLIDEKYADRAANAVHDMFIEESNKDR